MKRKAGPTTKVQTSNVTKTSGAVRKSPSTTIKRI